MCLHACSLLQCHVHVANCNPPLVPDGAYIIPNTSTLEGAEVTYICHGDHSLYKEKVIYTNKGEWEPNSSIICVQYSGITACPGIIVLHCMPW